MEEDWGAEAKANPEPTFNFPGSAPTPQQQRRPKQSFLRYVKVVHGRDMSAKVRSQLNAERITEKNFHQWKEKSLGKAIHNMENPPVYLLTATERLNASKVWVEGQTDIQLDR